MAPKSKFRQVLSNLYNNNANIPQTSVAHYSGGVIQGFTGQAVGFTGPTLQIKTLDEQLLENEKFIKGLQELIIPGLIQKLDDINQILGNINKILDKNPQLKEVLQSSIDEAQVLIQKEMINNV